MKKILAPSILSADFANLGRDVLTAIDAGAESGWNVISRYLFPSKYSYCMFYGRPLQLSGY